MRFGYLKLTPHQLQQPHRAIRRCVMRIAPQRLAPVLLGSEWRLYLMLHAQPREKEFLDRAGLLRCNIACRSRSSGCRFGRLLHRWWRRVRDQFSSVRSQHSKCHRRGLHIRRQSDLFQQRLPRRHITCPARQHSRIGCQQHCGIVEATCYASPGQNRFIRDSQADGGVCVRFLRAPQTADREPDLVECLRLKGSDNRDLLLLFGRQASSNNSVALLPRQLPACKQIALCHHHQTRLTRSVIGTRQTGLDIAVGFGKTDRLPCIGLRRQHGRSTPVKCLDKRRPVIESRLQLNIRAARIQAETMHALTPRVRVKRAVPGSARTIGMLFDVRGKRKRGRTLGARPPDLQTQAATGPQQRRPLQKLASLTLVIPHQQTAAC